MLCVGCCHVSEPPASGFLLPAPSDAQGGRPPFDPPPVLVARCVRAWPRVWRCFALAVATCLSLRPLASCFRHLLTPRGDDPPSTPRRCLWRSCLAEGVEVLCVGCCHVSEPPASGFLLPAPSDAQGRRPPFDPPPVLVMTDRVLGRGCDGACVGRCHVHDSTVDGQRRPHSRVSVRSTLYVLRCTSGHSAFCVIPGHPTNGPVPRLRSWSAMITRWTSDAPSQIRSTRSSRKNRSATFSRM